MAESRFPGSQPSSTGRRWKLNVVECTDGRLAVAGLPEDRAERLSVVMRLGEILRATAHADDNDKEGMGILWRRFCRQQFAALFTAEGTVELVPADWEVREAGQDPPR